jgi:type II secretory ATPase GspE/PulE/Tfp pilus assembly ATPase PilB-like protein
VLSKPFDRNELVDVFRQIVLMKRQVAPMRIDGLKKVLVGLTTVDAVLRVTPR